MFKFDKIGSDSCVVYEIPEEATIDKTMLGMLSNNRIQGLAQTQYRRINNCRSIYYNVSNYIPFSRFFTEAVDTRTVLSVMRAVVSCMAHVADWMIDAACIVTEESYAFINPDDLSVLLLAIPQESYRSSKDVQGFLLDVLTNIQTDRCPDSLKVLRLMKYIGGNQFSCDEMLHLIDDILSTNQNQYDRSQNHRPDISVQHENRSVEVKQELTHEVCPGNVTRVGWIPDAGASEEKNSRWSQWLRGKKRKQEKKADLPSARLLPNTSVSYNAVGLYPDETTVLSDYEYKTVPCIVRESTRERFNICKNVFSIGKERDYADLLIADNPVISRAHAVITAENGKYYITDTGSRNHTFVEGTMLPANQPCELKNGMHFRLANELFTFIAV